MSLQRCSILTARSGQYTTMRGCDFGLERLLAVFLVVIICSKGRGDLASRLEKIDRRSPLQRTQLSMSVSKQIGVVSALWTATFLLLHTCAVVAYSATSAQACIRAAPRLLTQHEKEQLCRLSVDFSTAPALCASAALRVTNAFPATTAQKRAEMLIELCARATDTGPASCWLQFPQQIRQQTDLTQTLLHICQDAHDTNSADCFLRWRKSTAFTPKRIIQDSVATVVELCKNLDGDVEMFSTCVLQAPRSLTPLHRFQMCQYAGSLTQVATVVACGNHLGRHAVPPRTIARVCAKADENAEPQACTLASMNQLRWMDGDSKAHLCEKSGTTDPVTCAAQLHRMLASRNAIGSSTAYTAADVARICSRTRNASVVVSCVKKTPGTTFTALQLSRLCSSSPVAADVSHDGPVHSSECVARAKGLLDFAPSSQLSRDSADLLFTLCEQATSSAPTDCMAAVQYDQSLSATDRVQLCQKAQTKDPQQCYSKLRSFIHSKKISVRGALALCSRATSLAPALCFSELAKSASTSFMESFGSQICAQALSVAPAKCYRTAPSSFSDHAKAVLCQYAASEAPAKCALYHATRITAGLEKAELCHRAQSTSPASCVMAAPFGMKNPELTTLCRLAISDFPAKCARSVSASSHVSWQMIAELCFDANSVTPANCLSQHVRHRALLTRKLLQECRHAVSTPASIKIAQVSYQCRELIPNCLITIHLRVLDQFGEEMPHWTGGYVHVAATATDATSVESSSERRVLLGQSHVLVTNGSAVFKDIYFVEAGEFVIAFGTASSSAILLEEKVTRIRIYEDKQAQLRKQRCSALFTRFECSIATTSPPLSSQHVRTDNTSSTDQFHVLELSNRFYLDAMSCEAYWQQHAGGLHFRGMTSRRLIYAIHRASYHFLTYVIHSLFLLTDTHCVLLTYLTRVVVCLLVCDPATRTFRMRR